MLVAATEEILHQLPLGNWVGGLACQFLIEGQCVESQHQAFAFDLTDSIGAFRIKSYHPFGLPAMYNDHYPHGFSVVILPAFSMAHTYFTLMSCLQAGEETVPFCGWVSGIFRHEHTLTEPQVVDGISGQFFHDRALVLHCAVSFMQEVLPDLVVPFQMGSGDTLEFEQSGFVMEKAIINGDPRPLVPYWRELEAQGEVGPLMTLLRGIPVTIAPLTHQGKHSITFASLLLPKIKYRLANPLKEMHRRYQELSQGISTQPLLSFYSHLTYDPSPCDGQHLGIGNGIFTLGEIGSQLFNYSHLHLSITEKGPVGNWH